MSASVRRPGGVTLVAVLTYLGGLLQVLAGILLLVFQNDPDLVREFGGHPGVVTTAIVALLIGIVTIMVARGLLNGSPGARMIVTILQLITIAGAVWVLFVAPAQFGSVALSALISLVIILLLWSGRASRFFSR